MSACFPSDYLVGDTIQYKQAALLIVGKIAPDTNALHKIQLAAVPIEGWKANLAVHMPSEPLFGVAGYLQHLKSCDENSVSLIDLEKARPKHLGEMALGFTYEMKNAMREVFAIGTRHTKPAGLLMRFINGQFLMKVNGNPEVFISFVKAPLGVFELPTLAYLVEAMQLKEKKSVPRGTFSMCAL